MTISRHDPIRKMTQTDQTRRLQITLPVAAVEQLRMLQQPDESFSRMVQRLLLEVTAI
jgi:hypothetical protein